MKKRILTALILAAILIPVVCVPALEKVFEGIVILFALIASFEILFMFDKEKKTPIGMKILSAFMTICLYCSLICNFKGTENTLVNLIIEEIFSFHLDMFLTIGIIFLVMTSCIIFVKDFDANDLGKYFLQIIYVAVTFASFTVLRTYGIRYIIYLLLVVMFTDVFALVFGLNFGKHKMAPNISPKKSWEGAFGGTIVATIIGISFVYLYPQIENMFGLGNSKHFFDIAFEFKNLNAVGMFIYTFIVTICMSVCGQLGDLVASKLKRTYGIKDYSNIFPGHGGVLDRFDSTLFAATIFVVLINVQTIINQLDFTEILPTIMVFFGIN